MKKSLRPGPSVTSSKSQFSGESITIFWGSLAFVLPSITYFFYRIKWSPIVMSDVMGVRQQFSDFLGIFSGVSPHPDAYRPLDIFAQSIVSHVFREHGEDLVIYVVIITSLFIGLLSYIIYHICFYYSKNKSISFLAPILYMFSAGGLSASWHEVWSPAMLIPLITICGAFLAYLKFRNTKAGTTRLVWFSLFVLSCLIGPYFREVAYVPVVVILGLELFRLLVKRSFFILIPIILLFHVTVPKAFVTLLGLYPGPVVSWMSEGQSERIGITTGSQLDILAGLLNRFLHYLEWTTAGYLINEFPPMLWLCIVPSVAYGSAKIGSSLFKKKYWASLLTLSPTQLYLGYPTSRTAFLTTGIVSLFLGILLVLLILPLFKIETLLPIELELSLRNLLLYGFLLLFSTLASFRFGFLLPAWFWVVVPLNVVLTTNHEVHLAFSIPPLAILCVLYLNDLTHIIRKIRFLWVQSIGLLLLFFAGSIIVFDHLGNIRTKFIAGNNISTGHRQIADWIKHNVPKGSVLIPESSPTVEVFYNLADSSSHPTRFDSHLVYSWAKGYPKGSELELIELIKNAAKEKKEIYWIHLTTSSNDNLQLVPIKYVDKLATFQINSLGFEFDPLRMLVNTKHYRRSLIYHEWDNTYARLGLGENRYIWRAEFEIYKLNNVDLSTLEPSDFQYLSRIQTPPTEAGMRPPPADLKVVWHNTTSSFESFSSFRGTSISRATNSTGSGTASTNCFRFYKGKKYQISFHSIIDNGIPPYFCVARDVFCNDPILKQLISGGSTNIEFEVNKTQKLCSVLTVDPGVESSFSIEEFLLLEIKP